MKAWLEQIVEPSIKDFEDNPTSRRHAFLACVATNHSVDYLAYDEKSEKPRKGLAGNYRRDFRGNSPEFGRIEQYANAFKHVVSDGQNPIRFRDVVARPPAAIGQLAIGISGIGDAFGGVTVAPDYHDDLLNDLRAAVRFLKSL